jgi:hypothetical protein
MDTLFMLNIVCDFPLLADSPLEVSGPGEVPGPPRQEDHVERPSIVIDLSLNEGTVDDRHDPAVAREGMQAALKLSREEVVPSIHVLRRRRGKRLRCHREEVILQAPCQIIGVREQEVFGEINDLVQALVSELSNLPVGESKAHAAFSSVPH